MVRLFGGRGIFQGFLFCETLIHYAPSVFMSCVYVGNHLNRIMLSCIWKLFNYLSYKYVNHFGSIFPFFTTSQCHPYLTVSVGKCKVDDRENHILDSVNPVFGKVFDLQATLPQDQTLTVSVMHRGYSADDLIGKTTIDLENRFLSTYHATCGLSQSFAVCVHV